MMTVDELPEQLRALHRPGDPLPTWHDPHEINTWGWPYHRRLHFDRYIRGEYLGGVDEIEDDAPGELLPLKRFDHPNLRRRTERTTDKRANRWAHRITAKACAGLRHDLRVPGAELRQTIRNGGQLSRKQRGAYRWTLGGIRAQELFTLVANWRLSIHDLAQVNALSFNSELAMSVWLNLWGANPDRPIPEGDDLTEEERARTRGYIVTPIEVFDAATVRQVAVVHYEPPVFEEPPVSLR